MERAEKQGLAVAAIGHVALFALLSLGLFSARIPKPPLADAMDVTIADTVGMQSAAPSVSTEAPNPSEAPDQGKPEDSAPPPPAPEPTPPPPRPVPPEPKPPEPKPPLPKPTPPKPTPPKPERPEPKPEKKPEPKPEKKPEPKPEKPKPVPEKPKHEAKPEKPSPAPEKAKPAPAPAKSAAKPTPVKKAPGLSSDFLKDLPKDPGTGKSGATAKPKGSRLGKDFLKGIGSDAAGKADAPRAAAVSARSMAGLVGMIAAQVKPCYNPPAGGADAGSIVTVLNIRMNRDGSVASVSPGEQTGVNGSNGAYARQMADAAVRAVRRCAPLKLPADLYEGGWDDFAFRFRPDAMQ